MADFWGDGADEAAQGAVPTAPVSAKAQRTSDSQACEAAERQMADLRKQLAAKTVALKKEMGKVTQLQKQLSVAQLSPAQVAPPPKPSLAAQPVDDKLQAKYDELSRQMEDLQAAKTSLLDANTALTHERDLKQKRIVELETALDAASQHASLELSARMALERTADDELESTLSELARMKDRTQHTLRLKDDEISELRTALESQRTGQDETLRARLEEETSALHHEVDQLHRRNTELEDTVAELQQKLQVALESDEATRLLEEGHRLRAEHETYKQVTVASIESKAAEVSNLSKEVVALRTELVAAKLAAEHSAKIAQQMSSIWNVPSLIWDSFRARALTSHWLEQSPAARAHYEQLMQSSRGFLPCLLVLTVCVCIALFLFVPRYIA